MTHTKKKKKTRFQSLVRIEDTLGKKKNTNAASKIVEKNTIVLPHSSFHMTNKSHFLKEKKKRKSQDRREQRRKFSGFWPCAAPGTYDREQKKEKKKEIKKRSRMMRSDLGWSIPSPCCCGCGGVEGSVEWKYRLERGLYKGKQPRFLRGERWWWE